MSAISPPSAVVHISFQTLFETQTKIVVFNSKIELKHAIMVLINGEGRAPQLRIKTIHL